MGFTADISLSSDESLIFVSKSGYCFGWSRNEVA